MDNVLSFALLGLCVHLSVTEQTCVAYKTRHSETDLLARTKYTYLVAMIPWRFSTAVLSVILGQIR